MRDPLSWSLPLGRLFGITLRMHVLFPVIVIALLLRAYYKDQTPGVASDVALLMAILFLSVLLHEFGHCVGARLVDGDAHEILLWPLGGLAAVEVPHKPRAHLIAVAMGPAVNLLICLAAGLLFLWLTDFRVRPPINPLWYPCRTSEQVLGKLFTWGGTEAEQAEAVLLPVVLVARVFWLNWVLFLLNVVVIGFPLDGGRLCQCLLWPWYGFRQATLIAIFAGFFFMVVIVIGALAVNEVFILFLGLFIYHTCRQQWILLETGGEDSLFGYDFSQGYTSLEGDAPPRRRRPNFWQRWLQRRAAQKRQREQEQREAEERRMDELLEKIQRLGSSALTDEERRFLKRVSDRYRHR
jgi:Zn-dependent protease